MAGETYLIAGVGEDTESGCLTLGELYERVALAINSEIPLDTPIKESYSTQLLRACLWVQKPLDLTALSFDELRRQVSLPGSMGAEKAEAAWNEIKRRLGEA